MMNTHPSDSAIQDYVLDQPNHSKAIIHHLAECEICSHKAASYKLLFTAIRQQPTPEFEDGFAASVMSRIPVAESVKPSNNFLVWLIPVIVFILTACAGYWYRKYLYKIFDGALPNITYMILIIAVTIVSLHGVYYYLNYQKRIKAINL